MSSIARSSFAATMLTAMIVLLMSSATVAQVATLRTPGPETEASPAPAEERVEGQEAILAFAQCMRDNGVQIDDPQFGTGGGLFRPGEGSGPSGLDRNSETFQAAFEACGSLLEALQPELDPEQIAEQNEALVDFAECMRAEGIEFPDPTSGQGFGFAIRAGGDGLDPFSDEFQTATAACQDSLDFVIRGPGRPAS